ncbi:MAG: hypothetical protein LC118_12160, partial [Dehalococcoidia bacterium]|nr:hypothetical protein [Dehalococcoidia bacterium]
FHEAVPETIKMASNPNVSVRMRGVMEKCTYCVQRIQSAKIASKRENRKVRDGEIKTACQQSCPADAIFFGDLNDKASQISRVMAVQHRYAVLEELNAQPRTTYIARITNPHPDLVQRDDAAAGGHAAPAGSADHAKGGH